MSSYDYTYDNGDDRDPNDWTGDGNFDAVYADDDDQWFSNGEKRVIASTCAATGEEDFAALGVYSYMREGQEKKDQLHHTVSKFVGAEVTQLFDSYKAPPAVCACECDVIEDDMAAYNCMLQTKGITRPIIKFSSQGPPHSPTFVGEAMYSNLPFITRSCSTKKDVEKHVAHIVMHHLPATDVVSNVYRFCEGFFSEMVSLRGDEIQWYRSTDHIVMVVGSGNAALSFLYADSDMSRGRYECMHSYNKFFQSYYVLPQQFQGFASVQSTYVGGSDWVASLTDSSREEISVSDPMAIKVLKIVRVVCGDEALRTTLRKVYLACVTDRDTRTFGDLLVGGVNIRLLMTNPSHAYLLERLAQMTVKDVKRELTTLQGKRMTEVLFDTHGITPQSAVTRVRQHSAPIPPSDFSIRRDVALQEQTRSSFKIMTDSTTDRAGKVAAHEQFDEVCGPKAKKLADFAISSFRGTPEYRFRLQGKSFVVVMIPHSQDPRCAIKEVYKRRINELFSDNLCVPNTPASKIALVILDFLYNAEYAPTSQEVGKHVRARGEFMDTGKPIVSKDLNRVLHLGEGKLWDFTPLGKDKQWRLKMKNCQYSDLRVFLGGVKDPPLGNC